MTATTAPARSDGAGMEKKLTIYDTDVHHAWDAAREVGAYLSGRHRERFASRGVDAGAVQLASKGGARGLRVDVVAEQSVAHSLELTRRQLLDGCGVGWALLTSGPVGTAATLHADFDYAN